MSSRKMTSSGKAGAKAPLKRATQTSKTGASPQSRMSTKVAQGGQSKSTADKSRGVTPLTETVLTTLSKKNVELRREQQAAVTIQCAVRRLLAKRELERKQKKKQDYEDLMERLEKEAFVAIVRRKQEEAQQEKRKEEEERKKKKEEQFLQRRLLEAAFDGETEVVLTVLKEASERDTQRGLGVEKTSKRQQLLNQLRMINITDANGNTAVSEAGAGGQPEVITLLVKRGADVNTQGAFGRTPIFRAAFGGHLAAVQTLLQLGADPRIYADDGSTPAQVASGEALVSILEGWDLSITDCMLKNMREKQQRSTEEEQKLKEAETDCLTGEVAQLQKKYERSQREVVHDTEDVFMKTQMAAQLAADQLSLAKLTLREQSGGDAVVAHGRTCCLVRDLNDVLLKDVGDKIKQDGRWPLLVDPSGQAATFLRYRDTNYLDAMNPENMQPEKLRMALLGAIRFGKHLVINMMEVDLFETVKSQLEDVKPGLSAQLMNKELLQEERYLSLVQSSDGPQYAKTEFRLDWIEKFRLVLVTKQRHPSDFLLTAFYPIEVMLPESRL
ncbi:IQ motif and ankyrin repeat domain-containing protein 1-like isoform X2 [Osmerus eperlanus]|uniref:IQ motif and ankyrin repeat domain-containing protein 1-like isoform X2 n=1 Tax=Osmerus eperlanus TaxID=29151 RepID=UPI002E0F247D